MKRFLLLNFCFILVTEMLHAQDIPVYSQKLTNSFLYNPAVAGNTLGSATLSYRQQWAGVDGSPKTGFMSVHTPFAKHRFGTGLNVYQENAGVNQNLFTSAAFAYHVRITDDNLFSMGVSAAYLNSRIYLRPDVIDNEDVLLRENQPGTNNVDFSFGLNYKTKFFSIGGSANRLGSLLGVIDSASQFAPFYTGYANFTLPLANGRDLLEPVVFYRNFSTGAQQFDVGLYYTYNSLATLGGSYRSGGATSITAAFRVNKNILIGYSRELFAGEFRSALGASNEFTLRLDFANHDYYSKAKNSRQINTQALALRRKTISTLPANRSPYSASNKNRNVVKKNYFKSPNYRLDSSRKLQTVRVKKQASFSKKRKKQQKRRRR